MSKTVRESSGFKYKAERVAPLQKAMLNPRPHK
jgi:hypothetical protein